MRRTRAMFAWVNRYVFLAGRNCCAGRSWVGLDRSLARRQDDKAGGSPEAPSFGSDELFVGARPERDPDEAAVGSTSSSER